MTSASERPCDSVLQSISEQMDSFVEETKEASLKVSAVSAVQTLSLSWTDVLTQLLGTPATPRFPRAALKSPDFTPLGDIHRDCH